jgi:membrane-associated phospholipid phosphatase
MLKKIIEIDQYLFLKINRDSRNDLFETIMPLLREAKFWIPLYLFMVVFVWINFGKKVGGWLLTAAITASTTDLISSKIFKPFFGRPRPCADPDFAAQVHLLANYCGSNGSFTSSHAATHFGIAMFFVLTFKNFSSRFIYLFFVWAAAICYAQVYVGVHYPTDILGGAVLGIMIGWTTAHFYNKKTGGLH